MQALILLAIYSQLTVYKLSVKLLLTHKPSEEMGLTCLLQNMNWEDPTLPFGVTGKAALIELWIAVAKCKNREYLLSSHLRYLTLALIVFHDRSCQVKTTKQSKQILQHTIVWNSKGTKCKFWNTSPDDATLHSEYVWLYKKNS